MIGSASGPGLAARMRAHLPAKLGVWLGLAVGICVPYFGLQHFGLADLGLPDLGLRTPADGAIVPPVTPIDRAVPFSPAWIHPYMSLGLLVPIAPLLASRPDELVRYARGLAWLCVPCFLVFLLVPVAGPRPEAVAASGPYAWIVSVDRPTNSLPSLHAGLTVYSLLYVDRVWARTLAPAARRWLRSGGLVWGALILYSTLATRQHWLLDLPPGMVIAWAAHRLAWRGAAPARAPAHAVHT